ncbi:MAG TPA: tape measure protein [Rhizobiaceae bacterium]|nr:tape measure protein [Rhizobiaceae bacterium]
MNVVADKVIVELLAKLDQYNANVVNAERTFDRSMNGIVRSVKRTESLVQRSATAMSTSLVTAFAVVGGIRGMQSLLDSATKIDNALKVAGLSGAELEKVYSQLRDSAQRNAAPLEALVQLYSRASQAQMQLNASSDELVRLSNTVAMALRVSGQDASQASGALLQLGQALSGGKVQAEEYNSMIDGLYPLLQAAAAGLREAGGDVGKLTQLVKAGEVSSEAFFRAIEAGSYVLEEKLGGATLTTSQALENVRTAAIDAMRDFARGALAAEGIGEAFQMLANVINGTNFEAFGEEVRKVVGWLSDLREAVRFAQNFAANFSAETGLDRVGEFLTGGAVQRQFGPLTISSTRALQSRIDEAFSQTVETAGAVTEDALKQWAARNGLGSNAPIKTDRLPETAPRRGPVSLSDFDAPVGSGSGGRKGRREREDAFERESRQVKERTAALQAESEALSRINPLVKDYGYAVERARAAQELLSAAERAGLSITPELRANIDALADGYARAEAEANKLSERQDQIVQASDFVKESLADAFMEMVPAIETGNKALDNLLNTLIEAVAQAALLGKGPLAGLFGGGGGLLSLIGFAGGGVAAFGRPQPMKTFARGGIARSASIFGEAGPEAAVPLPDGRRIPVDLRVPERSSGSQNVHVTVGVSTDGNGNLLPFVQSVAQSEANKSTAGLARSVPKMVDQRNDTRQTRRTRA